MAMWLYQMSSDYWAPERYREEVWEGDESSFTRGTVRTGDTPESGDSILLWYAKTKAKGEPGIYGWGVLLGVREDIIRWRPVFPSDYLKLDPLFDRELSDLIVSIRGPMPQGTMWSLSKSEVETLRRRIRMFLERSD
jgi:hypothetical protein